MFRINKLFCTFLEETSFEDYVIFLTANYTLLSKKVFLYEIEETGKELCTYILDIGNLNLIPKNTILMHKKKLYNTLYTINALNELIKKENNGVLDKNFPVDWEKYQDQILLIQYQTLNTYTLKQKNILSI